MAGSSGISPAAEIKTAAALLTPLCKDPLQSFGNSTPFTWHNWPLLPLETLLTSHLLISILTYWPDFYLLGKLTEIFIHALHLAVNSRLLVVICLSDLLIIYITH